LDLANAGVAASGGNWAGFKVLTTWLKLLIVVGFKTILGVGNRKSTKTLATAMASVRTSHPAIQTPLFVDVNS
jgi:hypothetical protein